MNNFQIALKVLINIVPLAIIVLNLVELYELLHRSADYPFSSEFFSENSIYSSWATYLFYVTLSTVFLILLILASFSKKKWRYFILLFINAMVIVYPLVTNE
jgi:hypothetical protein